MKRAIPCVQFSCLSSERVRAMRAQADDVLEEDLVVGLAHARVIARVLQANAAEFTRAPIDHQGVLLRLIAGEDREVRRREAGSRRVDADGTGVEPVVAIARAPRRQELIDALRIPARLARIVAIGERGARAVENERPVFLAAEVLALELEVVVRRVAVRRPLEDAARDPQAARAVEAVADAGRGIVERALARVGTQMR